MGADINLSNRSTYLVAMSATIRLFPVVEFKVNTIPAVIKIH